MGEWTVPKQTFYNLPEDKRIYIENCAIEEFAVSAYDKVSISKIVEKAGIAKGSFYQYFDGKIDLASYLLERIAYEELAYIEKNECVSLNESDDFFDWLRHQIGLSLQFAFSNMNYIQAYKRLLAVDIPALNDVLARVTGTIGVNFYVKKIKIGVETGKLRNDLSPEFLGQYVMIVMFSLLDSYFKTGADDGTTVNEELMTLINQSIDVIENGIKKKGDSRC